MTTAVRPITAVKVGSSWLVRQQIDGRPDWECAEYKVESVSPGCWALQSIQLKSVPSPTGGAETVTPLITDQNSVFECVGEIAASAGGSKPAQFARYYGQAHGNVSRVSESTKMDFVEVESGWWTGSQFSIEQKFNILNPGSGAIIGGLDLRHTFSADGLLIEHDHDHAPGQSIYNFHAVLVPMTAGLKFLQVGDSPVHTLKRNGSEILFPPADRVLAWSDAHPYQLEVTLPTGTIGDPHGWTHAGPEAWRFLDNTGAYAKLYGEYVRRAWEARIPTTHHEHKWRLRVLRP